MIIEHIQTLPLQAAVIIIKMEPINTEEGIKQRDKAREHLFKKAEDEMGDKDKIIEALRKHINDLEIFLDEMGIDDKFTKWVERDIPKASDKEVRHSTGAVNGAVKPKGCGKEFTYDKDGDEYICGEEFEYDSGEESDSGCGYLLCPACSKENNLKVASLCENCGRTEAQHPIHPLSLTFARCQEFKPKKEDLK